MELRYHLRFLPLNGSSEGITAAFYMDMKTFSRVESIVFMVAKSSYSTFFFLHQFNLYMFNLF